MKVMSMILLFFCSLSFVFAGSGSAMIPNVSANGTTNSDNVYYISNISNNDVDVTLTFYDQDGNVITSGISYTNFTTSNTVIEAGSTGVVTFSPTTWLYGYAVIEWSNQGTDNDAVALVANGYVEKVETSHLARYTVMINCGQAF